MNKKLKNILIFAAGVGVGALAAYIILNRRYEEYLGSYEETFEDSEDGNEEQTLDENGYPIKKPYEESEDYKHSVEETAAVRSDDNKVVSLPKSRYKKLVRRYDTMYSKNNDVDPAELERPSEDDDDQDEFRKISEDYYNHNKSEIKPYVITNEEFAEDMTHFDKLTIYYYEDDQTLADENEEIIQDVSSTVGDEALDKFGDGSDDPEIVYVRNEKMEIDYEVIRLSKSYKETVGGFTEDKE